MATAGQVLDEGAEQIEFLATAADTAGVLVRARVRSAPGRPAPPEHSHPRQEERFTVEHGLLGYVRGSSRLTASSGEVVVVPAGTNHTFWNAGDGELSVVTEVRPALRFESFVETIHVLIRDGRLPAGGKRPNPLLLAVVAQEFRDEWRLTNLPGAARSFLPLLAFLGRRLGYDAFIASDAHTSPRSAPAV